MKLFVIAVLAVAIVSGVPVADKTQECEPGSFFKDRCNDCRCSDDGLIKSCTLKNCEETGDEPIEERKRRDVDGEKCNPGETKYDGCNNCFCLPDGSGWGCTLKACISTICEPNSKFMKDCNSCTCGSDGFSEVCTRKACPSAMPKTTDSA